jgi:error-prone DNA polymerase
MGLRLLPPDVNQSGIAYTGRRREIRVGLMQLKDLRQEAQEALVRERERGGPYASFAAFLDRTRPHVHLQDVRVLVRGGCFDRIEGPDRRPILLWEALRHFHRDETPAQSRLFGPSSAAGGRKGVRRPLDRATRMRCEMETLGFPLSMHPLERYREVLRRMGRTLARDLPSCVGRVVTLAGWLVTGKTVHSRQGDPMKFVSFEDETALYETVFFPREYRRFCSMLGRGRAYVVKGKVERDLGAITVTAGWIGFLDRQDPLRSASKGARPRPHKAVFEETGEARRSLAAEPDGAWNGPGEPPVLRPT